MGLFMGFAIFSGEIRCLKFSTRETNLVGAPKSYLMGTHYIQNISHTTKNRWDRTCGGLTQKIYLAHWVQQRQKQWPLEADEIGLVGAWPGTFTWDMGARSKGKHWPSLTIYGVPVNFPDRSDVFHAIFPVIFFDFHWIVSNCPRFSKMFPLVSKDFHVIFSNFPEVC